MPEAPALIVAKLGGSLLKTGAAAPLARALSARPGLVLVPGGGAFADLVRDAQPQWDLCDATCHRMAILAMEQCAHALRDMAPALRPCRTMADMAALAADRAAGIWLPAAMILERTDIPMSWDVTSDSLACWLAAEIGAAALVLVKAPGLALPPAGDRAQALALWSRAAIVDKAFAGMAERFGGPIACVAADDAPGLARALAAA